MATQNYYTIKNAALITPATATDLGSVSQPYGNLYLQGNVTLGSTTITSTNSIVPKITSLSYPGSATAADLAGGQTITVNGTGFLSGISVYVANTIIGSASVVSSTQVTFTSTAQTAGSYTLSVVNTDGGSASYVPGLTYSALPVWSTAAGSLGSSDGGATISTITLAATENSQSITYAVTSGSLPTGLSLASNGNITGTLSSPASTTTYNFTVTATDPQNQTASRNFSYTVNTVFMSATGGTITTDGNYKVHAFTNSGTFTVTGSGSVDYLVIAGGASGGITYSGFSGYAGGGGAGGALTGTASLTSQAYTVTVGAGGATNSVNGARGTTGSNTTCFGLTAYGGGGGGGTGASNTQSGNSGGSGGGGGDGGGAGGAGTNGQGNSGGGGGGNWAFGMGGGGGGAGGAGESGSYGSGWGHGGIGITSSISGTSTKYAGGGGGQPSTGYGSGGNNGGAGGGSYGGGRGYAPGYSGVGTEGSQNTGGGGGAGGYAGGSGVVIIRYQFQ